MEYEVIRPPLWEMLLTFGLVFLFGLLVSSFYPKHHVEKVVLSTTLGSDAALKDNLQNQELAIN